MIQTSVVVLILNALSLLFFYWTFFCLLEIQKQTNCFLFFGWSWVLMTCCHYVIFRTYFDNFDRVQGNMNGPEALKSKKTTKSLKQQNAARLITSWRDFIGRETSFWIAGNVTQLLKACHDCEEGSRRTLGCYKIVTRLNIGAARFLDQKIFPI